MVPVAYREQNLAIQDHGEGRIHVVLTAMTSALPLVQAGKVKFVAVTNSRRSPALPEVPTTIESGYPELAFEGFAGFFGSRGMPIELRDRIAADIRAAAADPALIERLAAVGQVARGGTPAEFSAMIDEQHARMASIVKSLGLKPQR
jgi:tripartite-type tricarboxylate transporter receptor subunit TctC